MKKYNFNVLNIDNAFGSFHQLPWKNFTVYSQTREKYKFYSVLWYLANKKMKLF